METRTLISNASIERNGWRRSKIDIAVWMTRNFNGFDEKWQNSDASGE
jgi:hypothetical protein